MARRSALRRAREGKGRRAKAFAPSFAFAGGGPGATDSGAGRAGGGNEREISRRFKRTDCAWWSAVGALLNS